MGLSCEYLAHTSGNLRVRALNARRLVIKEATLTVETRKRVMLNAKINCHPCNSYAVATDNRTEAREQLTIFFSVFE